MHNLHHKMIREAAQAKGSPLSQAELDQVNRKYLRERFLNVIRLAGYIEGAPESICNKWFDKLIAKGIPEFEAMCKSYEDSDGDPI